MPANFSPPIQVAVERATGLSCSALVIALRRALDFQSNNLYDVWAGDRHLILKEYLRPEEVQDAPRREYQALRLLSALDIAPQPVFYDPAVGPIVIYEYMDGEMWDRCPWTPAGLADLAALWLKVGALPVDWLARGMEHPLEIAAAELESRLRAYADWAAAVYEPGKPAAELCLRALTDRAGIVQELAACRPRLRFCRSDPRFANVIQRPGGRLGLVDWEDSGLRDPARELADIVTHPNQEDLLTWGDWQAFIQTCTGEWGEMDAGLVHRLHLYLAIFPLFWLSVLVRSGMKRAAQGRIAGWMVNGLPANERLRRYLARALAWPEMDFAGALDALGDLQFFQV